MTPALARRSDPATSHEAAAQIAPAVDGLERAVLAQVVLHGSAGVTMHDVADRLGIPLVSASPRFAPLQRKSQIVAIGKIQRRTLWMATIPGILQFRHNPPNDVIDAFHAAKVGVALASVSSPSAPVRNL